MSRPPQRRRRDLSDHHRKLRFRVGLALVFGVVVVSGVWYWRLSDSTVIRDGAPSWSPDGQQLVFLAEIGSEPADLYVMNADGTRRRRLTQTPASESGPAFSPDGQSIAFESTRDGSSEIYVMNLAGTDVRRLTKDPASDTAPAWSPDGSRIAFMSDRDSRAAPDIYTMDARDGSDMRRLTNDLANWAPQYSPDGTTLAVQIAQDVALIDLASGAIRHLTSTPDNGMNPTWAPDGRRLAFVTTRNGGRAEIYAMNADGTNQQVLVSMPGGDVFDPRWSPAGDRLAFVYVPRLAGSAEASAPAPHGQAIYTLMFASGKLTRLSR